MSTQNPTDLRSPDGREPDGWMIRGKTSGLWWGTNKPLLSHDEAVKLCHGRDGEPVPVFIGDTPVPVAGRVWEALAALRAEAFCMAGQLTTLGKNIPAGGSVDRALKLSAAALASRPAEPHEPCVSNGWPVERGVTCVSCPDCAFTFDAMHADEDGSYSCPLCAEARSLAASPAERTEPNE